MLFRCLLLPMITLGFLACHPSGAPSHTAADHSNLQWKSLGHVYFAGAPMPPLPDQNEMDAALNRLKSSEADEREIKLLEKLFSKSPRNLAMALRDTDGDGVLDFRVSHYAGKFVEGDIDVDGDGIRNILDSAPYDSAFGGNDLDGDGTPDENYADENQNLIPDHVDWAYLKKELSATDPESFERIVEIQQSLYSNHKITIVERTLTLTPEVIESLNTTITKVFRKTFGKNKSLSTLRTIAAEQQAWLLSDDGEACALFFSPNQTLTMLAPAHNMTPLSQIGLITHEIGHGLHFAKDYDSSNEHAENARNWYPMPNLLAEIEPFGWSATTPDDVLDHKLFAPLNEIMPTFKFRNKSLKYWTAWLEKIYEEVGYEYLTDKRVRSKHIVSDYSLINGAEWYGDNISAALMVLLEDQAISDMTPEEAEVFQAKFSEIEAEAWPGFDHNNIRGSEALEYFKKTMGISKSDLKSLSKALLDF